MSVDLWSVIPFANSLRINIELEQATPSISLSNYGASQVKYKIYVSSDSGYNYQNNKVYLKIGNEVVCDIDSPNYRIQANVIIAQGTTSTYFQRQENGYLNIPCIFQFQGRNKSSTVFTYNHTFIGDSFTMRTKCSAPTSFTCNGITNGAIIAPQTLTFTWSGAAAGTNNSIAGYTIYYKIASSLTYPTISDNSGTIDISSTATSGTKTWSLSGNRGNYIAFKILTKGSVSGYDSDLSSASFYIKVNTVPTAPTVTYNSSAVTSIVLKSSESSVIFGVSGSTDIDSQAITYYYGTSSSKTLINNNQVTISSPSVGTSTNINFYANDGLEYGSPKTVNVTRNKAPAISTITLTGVSYSAGAGTTYILTVQPSIKVNKTGVGTVGIEAIIRTGSSSGTEIKTAQISSKAVAANTSVVSFETFNIQQIIGSSLGQDYNSSNTYWVNFKISYNDGVETSTVTTVIDSQSREIKSAPAPSSGSTSDIHIYNQFSSTTDIAGTSSGQFYDKLRVISYKDDSLDPSGYTCAAKFGNVTYPVTFNTNTDGNYRYFDITFSTIPPANTEGTITITGTDGYVTKSYTTWTIKETKVPSVGGTFSSTISTIQMFNSQPVSYINTLTWPFGQYTSYTKACAKEYNLSDSATTAIKIRLSYGNSRKNCTITAPTKSGDNLSSEITPNNLFDWTTSPINLTPYQGIKNLTIQYVITNLFGQEFLSPSKTIQFNFNRSAVLSGSNITLTYASSSSGTKTAIGTKYLQEDAYLFFNISSLNLYTTEQFTLNIYAQSADGTNSLPKTLRKTIVYSQNQSGIKYGTGYNTAGNNTINDIAYGQLPQLGASSYTFTIEIVGQYSGTISVTKTVNAIKRAPSNTILQSCSYSNGNWTYQAIRDNGLGGANVAGISTIYQLCNSQGDLVSNTNLTQDFGTIASSITLSGSIYLKIKTTVTLNASASNSVVMINKTYVYYSSLVIVYANTATVAYRVHSIGINTGSIESKGIVEIHGIDGRDQIVLKNQTSSISNSAVLDLTTLNLNLVKTVVSTSSTTSVAINLMNLGKISSSATTAKTYLFAGTCTTGAQSVYTNASCYMSNGYLYSGGTKVDMGELYKLNPTTSTATRYLTAVTNTTGIQLVNTNVNCYMSSGHLYSNSKKVMTLITAAQTTTSKYYIKGSPSTGNNANSEQLYDNVNCYMLNGYLYSNGTKVDMAELYKLNPTVTTSSVYIPGVLNTTGVQVVYTNASCYMSNGHLYSGGIKTLVVPRENDDWNDVNYLIGYRENEERPVFSASCYTFEEYLYSNGERVISQEDMLIVPLYIKPSGTNGYSVGVIRFYKCHTQKMAIAEFNSYGASASIPMGSFTLLFPGTDTSYVLPTSFKPTSGKTIIGSDFLYKGDSKSASYTSTSKLSLVINSNGTITLTISGGSIGADGWQRRGHIIY